MERYCQEADEFTAVFAEYFMGSRHSSILFLGD